MKKELEEYEIRVLTRRLVKLTGALTPTENVLESEEWHSRRGFIETLEWVDTQEAIDREASSPSSDT